jgi:hypothetical protein
LRAIFKATVAVAALAAIAGYDAITNGEAPAAAAGAAAQPCAATPGGRTIFNTPDFKQDRALWTNPGYYLCNTPGELGGMAFDVVTYEGATGQSAGAKPYGTPGTAVPATRPLFQSPYPYKTAKEHWDALVAKAPPNGGTKHTRATLPDWSGLWGGGGGFGGGRVPPSDIVKVLKPEYAESYVQERKAASEGRIWGAGSFCLPGGFALGFEEIMVTPTRVYMLSSGNGNNTIRWVYTDGSGHSPEDLRFPKWQGESIGIWNGDELYIYTNQIRGWKGMLQEYTDNLEVIEVLRREGDTIVGETIAYDSNVWNYPLYAQRRHTLDTETMSNPALRPLYNTCTDTNGPSPKVYMDEKGLLNERLLGEGGYNWDVADPRPWKTYFDESDRRFKAYLEAGGDPPGRPEGAVPIPH